MNNIHNSEDGRIVYWHRELPPLDAELMAEHTVEATSGRVAGTLGHRDELWDRCYQELMANTSARLAQEIALNRRPLRTRQRRINRHPAQRCD